MNVSYTLKSSALITTLVVVVALFFGVQAVSAQANPQINYQGKLTDGSGIAVPDGTYNMNFWLIASGTAATSSAIWSESLTGTDRVQVTNGLFSVMLGSSTPLTGVDFNQTLYLGVEIGGTSTPLWDGEMSPRKILGTVPAAFVANYANTAGVASSSDEALALGGVASSSFLRSDEADTMEATSTGSLLTLIQNGAGAVARFFSGASEIFTVLNNGNVGIGTSSPSSTLTVAGNSYLGGSLTVTGNTTLATTTVNNLFLTQALQANSGGTGLQVVNQDELLIGGAGNTWTQTTISALGLGNGTFIGLTDTPSSYTANRILFTNSGASAVTDSASFVFDGTNLGIGSTTPSARLTVQGAAGTANIATFASSTGSTTLALLANGNLELPGQLISAGVEWTERSATEANSWTSITYGNGRFVAIAFDGTNRIMTSDDGVSWTAVAAPDQRVWQSVTYGNGLFVAVCSYTDAYAACERTMYSKDGITWATSSPAASGNWYSVTYGNGKFVAVGQSGSSRVMTSPDGINWSLQTAAELNYWYGVTYGNGKFVAVGALNSGSNVVMTSPDGITWTAQSAAGDDDSWVSVTYGNGLFVAVGTGDDYVMTSPDGVNWTLRNVVDNGWRAVTYGNGRFVAIAWTGTNRVITSGFTQTSTLAHNNIYQGETSFMTQVSIGTTTKNELLTVAGNTYISGNLSALGVTTLANASTTNLSLSGALYDTTNSAGTSGMVLQTTGTSTRWVATSSLGFTSGATTFTALTDTPSSYTANRILFTNSGASAVTDSASFVFDGTNLGIGSTTPSARLTVVGSGGSGNVFTVASTSGHKLFNVNSNGGVRIQDGLYSDATSKGLLYVESNTATSSLHLVNFGPNSTTNYGVINEVYQYSGADSVGVQNILSSSYTGYSYIGVENQFDAQSGGVENWYGVKNTAFPGGYLIEESGVGTSTFYGLYNYANSSQLSGRSIMYGLYTDLSNDDDAIGQEVYGTYAVGTTYTGANDLFYGNYVRSSATSTGGTQYGMYVDLTAGTATKYAAALLGGAVGIGTSTPSSLLSLVGTSGQTSPLFTISSSTGAALFNLLADGSLDIDAGGIYYDASTRQTSIESLNLGAINFADDAGAVSWVDMAVTGAAATGTIMSYSAQLDNNPLLTIYGESAGSGNVQNLRVGIGSTTPSSRLSVVGNAGSENIFTFASSTGSALLSLTSGGRLVFSTTTSTNILINGGATSTSPALGARNIAIGSQAFSYYGVSALDNIALGYQALFGSSTVPSSGTDNFAAGYQAMQNNTTGYYNAAIGYRALRNNTTGVSNFAVGNNALANSRTASNNIAIGDQALSSNTTGFSNIAMGLYTLGINSTGIDNIGMGREVLYFNDTGSSNIALGKYAMQFNDTGSYNNAFGEEALQNLLSGSYNNAFGFNSLKSYNGTGTIGIGYRAGDALTDGDRNIIIGYDVDFDNASTSLGLNIGNLIYGTNVDGMGTTKSTGNIGIGTSTPGSKLTVAGDINFTGALRANGNAGTSGYILQTTGTGVQWVATSSLGFTSGATTFTALTDTPSSYTANRILFTNSGASAVTDSASFVFDGTNLGIGSTTPSARLTVQGAAGTANIATFASSTGSTTLALLANGNLELPGQLISAGIEWTGRSAAGDNDSWTSVTYGNGRFVAVGEGYISGESVMYSSDGINWATTSAAGNDDSWRSVTYGNGLFVAVGVCDGFDCLMTSPDGITWTTRTSPPTGGDWTSVTYGNGLFVAVANNGTDQVMTSPDGITWTARTEAQANQWNAVTYGNGKFVAVSGNGTSRVMTSSDGVTWTARSAAGNDDSWSSVTYGNGKFVAVGSGSDYSMTSSDGVTWTARTVSGSNDWRSVTYGNGLFVAVANSGFDVRAVTSFDGVTWVLRSAMDNSEAWRSVTYGNGRFVAVNTSGTNSVMTSGFMERMGLAHNNIYQGGTSFMGGLQAGTTTASALASIFLQSEAGKNPFAIASSTGAQLLTLTQAGALGLGTSTPFAAGLTIERTGVSGTSTAGIGQYLTFSNSVAAAQQFGNNTYISASNTATTTLLGSFLRIQDNSVLGNTVRGFEVQADLGANTLGENTAISAYARTLGVRGYTSGDAGASIEPAGVYGETGGTTQGNAIRGYSSTITTAALLKLFQDSSTFTGTGLLMNFGNAGGSFSSTTASRFIDLKNAGTSMFTVGAYGMLTIGDGSTTTNAGIQIGYGGICVDNDGSCTASTTGRITAVEYGTANSDLAENYFTSEDLLPGEVVYLKGGLSVGRATQAGSGKVIGVVSTAPGIIMGDNDSSLTQGERAVPIGLAGRVPVRISDENGEVEVGDELMLSSIPGVVMKASSTGQVIGRALEAFDATRAYSDTYINQFGENIIVPEYTPINRVSDPRIDDGCYYGGGNRTGEESCVPLLATTTDAQYDEADRLAAEEAKAAALAALARVPSEEVDLNDDETVQVGQIVMFIDRGFRYLDADGMAMVAALIATTTERVGGEEIESTLWQRLVTLAQNFVEGVLTITGLKTDRIETKELCVDGICLNASDLRTLLNESAAADQNVSSDGGVLPEPIPEIPSVPTPAPEPTPEPGPAPMPEVSTTTNPILEEATSTEPVAEEEDEPVEEVTEEVTQGPVSEVAPEPEITTIPEPTPLPEPAPSLPAEPTPEP